jgi:outer membrane protein OmpA-like peptidoglycan-associated protein
VSRTRLSDSAWRGATETDVESPFDVEAKSDWCGLEMHQDREFDSEDVLGEAWAEDRSELSDAVWSECDRYADDTLNGHDRMVSGWASDEAPESLAEESAETHPLMQYLPLPIGVVVALGRGLTPLAVRLAAAAGTTDVTQLTNIVFYFRHPEMIGRKIEPDQRQLAAEWIAIRDDVVKPALHSMSSSTTPSTPARKPTTSGVVERRAALSSANLTWPGHSAEELAFMRAVYDRQAERSRGDFVADLPSSALSKVDGYQARHDAAEAAARLLAEARVALVRDHPNVRIGIISAYRPASRQFTIWQGRDPSGDNKGSGFPYYYSQAIEQGIVRAGDYSSAAVDKVARYFGKYIASPGYSNHQDGLALDFGTAEAGRHLRRLSSTSWFHGWLTRNGSRFRFEPLASEAWHWTYRPPAPEPEAWLQESNNAAVTADPSPSRLAPVAAQAAREIDELGEMETSPFKATPPLSDAEEPLTRPSHPLASDPSAEAQVEERVAEAVNFEQLPQLLEEAEGWLTTAFARYRDLLDRAKQVASAKPGSKSNADIPPDSRTTTSWAIASLGGGGILVGYSLFLLVNRETGRSHGLHIPTGGLTTMLGAASASPPSYTLFETSRPVNFADFDGIGARITAANIGIFFGYSVVYLTLWDGAAYADRQLAYIKMGGWAAMIPGGSVAHGITKVSYGSGARIGTVPLVIGPEPDDVSASPALSYIRMAAKESPRLTLPSDLLFDFDSFAIKASAQTFLLYLADLLNNRRSMPVEIEGHSDSIGSSEYNVELSRRRAQSVKDWLVAKGVYGAQEFQVVPYGETQPVAPNRRPDGSDDPQGRRKNRRVVVRAEWNV